MVKNPSANAEDTRDEGSIPGSGISPGVGNGHPLQYSCLETLHRQRSLAGYSPCGCKESDIIEPMRTCTYTHTHTHTHTVIEETPESSLTTSTI